MIKCKVVMDFYDKHHKEVLRKIGEELEVSEERFKELETKKLVVKAKDEKPTAKSGVIHEKSAEKSK